jgi:hypothetical protein
MDKNIQVFSGFNLVLGLWLIISPFLLHYSDMAVLWNSIVVGVLVIMLAWMRESNPTKSPWMSWINAFLGLWMVTVPFIMGAADSATTLWNCILVGGAITVLGTLSAMVTPF